jgi:hypothetical protein
MKVPLQQTRLSMEGAINDLCHFPSVSWCGTTKKTPPTEPHDRKRRYRANKYTDYNGSYKEDEDCST